MKDIFQVIKTIHMSEKASLLDETTNPSYRHRNTQGKDHNSVYVFKVDRNANKLEIKEAVEKLFGKKVLSVRTSNCQGKKKRERRADAGRTAHWKKAVVTLQAGETIDLV